MRLDDLGYTNKHIVGYLGRSREALTRIESKTEGLAKVSTHKRQVSGAPGVGDSVLAA